MKTNEKIYQVQGNAKARYVLAASKTSAIKKAKDVYPTEKIDFASDFSDKFTKEEKENLPEYVIR